MRILGTETVDFSRNLLGLSLLLWRNLLLIQVRSIKLLSKLCFNAEQPECDKQMRNDSVNLRSNKLIPSIGKTPTFCWRETGPTPLSVLHLGPLFQARPHCSSYRLATAGGLSLLDLQLLLLPTVGQHGTLAGAPYEVIFLC